MSDWKLMVLLLCSGGLLVYNVPLIIRVWRNEEGTFDDAFGRSPLPSHPAGQRAFRRLLPLSVVALGIVALSAASELALGGEQTPHVVTICLLIIALMVEMLAVMVAIVNWPKSLVPPHLRDRPGYLRDRFGHGAPDR